MKKLTIMLVCLFALQGLAKADNDQPIEVNQLPKKSLDFLKQHFADISVSYAKIEKELLDKQYDVVLTGGQKIEFDKNGEWTNVDCKHTVVPAAIIPQQIKEYVKKKFPEQKIIQIERNKKTYEIELNNKLEVKFDQKFNVIEIDN